VARAGGALSVDDLVQEGSLALLAAIGNYARELGSFDAYAHERIRVGMDAALAAEHTAAQETERIVAAANDFDRAEYVLAAELQRKPTGAELAQRLRWSEQRVESVGELVEEARRRHDEELLAYLEPELVEILDSPAPDGR
jgi:RNA polymerase primary sigma factor